MGTVRYISIQCESEIVQCMAFHDKCQTRLKRDGKTVYYPPFYPRPSPHFRYGSIPPGSWRGCDVDGGKLYIRQEGNMLGHMQRKLRDHWPRFKDSLGWLGRWRKGGQAGEKKGWGEKRVDLVHVRWYRFMYFYTPTQLYDAGFMGLD